ncbi:MAG: substrate-binding domain-containing protein [Desulfobacterota bacterium]|nr:substrate-binding domain-containing protein [Thermodesulfobacteriota bacterium]
MPGRPFLIHLLILALVIPWSNGSAQQTCNEVYGSGERSFSVATGSPGELGLLKILGEAFAREAGASLCWIKAGSGASFQLLRQKKVDVILVHAPEAEEQAIREGWAARRTLVGYNEFFLVGPPEDPAKITGAASAAETFRRIASRKAFFFSRGDNSGTHQKEMAVWRQAGIQPEGDWYRITRTFMSASLKKAHEGQGYFLTDSSTWVMEKDRLPRLKVLFQGDPLLINAYHGLCQPNGATPASDLGARFLVFLASERGQGLIGEFGQDRFGQGIYKNARPKSEKVH